jgi:hypothetical protein
MAEDDATADGERSHRHGLREVRANPASKSRLSAGKPSPRRGNRLEALTEARMRA